MRLLCVVFVVITLMFCLFSCTREPIITEGEVVEKLHKPYSRTLMLIPLKVGDITIMQQIWIINPERWAVIIYDGEFQETFYMTELLWEAINIGEYYVFCDNTASRDEPEIREKVN